MHMFKLIPKVSALKIATVSNLIIYVTTTYDMLGSKKIYSNKNIFPYRSMILERFQFQKFY